MRELLLEAAEVSGCVSGIIACACVLLRPIRERIIGASDIKEGQKCLLRSEMLHIYYKNCDSKTIRQYENENFLYLYDAYKKLGGNSFIDKIRGEIQEWDVVS